MTDMGAMTRRVAAWHTAKFPEAQMANVALKLAEETGEVAEAVNHLIGRNSATAKRSDVAEEAADVVIVLMVLLGRWLPGIDLGNEVRRKISLLETPGAHKSSLEE